MTQHNQIEITNIIENNMMKYSYAVLTDRAIPTIQDGFKPVARRIMFILKNKNINTLTKSMNVTGLISSVHAHGTTYDTIVKMVQKDNWQTPLIDGHGNFSLYSSKNLQAGADRYTEIKISDFGKEMTKLVPSGVVTDIPNYDGTVLMPVVMPVTFPLVLIQSQSGIGVGYSSSTLSYNMKEVADVIKHYTKTGKIKKIYPDFPSKSFILEDKEELKNSLTGKASFTLESKIESIDKSTIRISEFPYGVKYESIVDKIVALVKDGKLPGVVNVKDLNDFNGVKIEVYTRKNADHNKLIEILMKKTQLRSKVNSNPNLIDIETGNPRVYGFEEIIKVWVEWRKNVYKNQLQAQVSKIDDQLYHLNGLQKVVYNIDELVNIIRFEKKNLIVDRISERFDTEIEQSKSIMSMKLYNINTEYINDQLKEKENLESQKNDLLNKIEDDTILLSDISKEVSEIAKKYGVDRQTQIKKEV